MMLRVALLLLAAIVAVSCDERSPGHPENHASTETPASHGRSHPEDHGTTEAPQTHAHSLGHPEDHGTTEAPQTHAHSLGHPEDHGTTEAPQTHAHSLGHPEDHGTTEAPASHHRQFHPRRRLQPPQPSLGRPTTNTTTTIHALPPIHSKFFEATATLPHPIYSNYICNTFRDGADAVEKTVSTSTNSNCGMDDIRFASFMRTMQMLARDNGETNNGEGNDDDSSDEDDDEQETEGEQMGETEGEQNMEDELNGRSLNELRMFASRALSNPSSPHDTPQEEVYDMVRMFLMSDDMSEEDEKEMHVKMLMSLEGKITVNLPKKRSYSDVRPDSCPEVDLPGDLADSVLREMAEFSLQKTMTSSDHSKIDVTTLLDTMKDLYKQKDDVTTYFDDLMAESTFKDKEAACYLLELYAGSPTTPCGIAAIATAAYDKFHCHVNTSLAGERIPATSRLTAASEEPFFLTSRIVGGNPTGSCSAVPWQARISRNSRNHICGGSILDSTHILTAAHCVYRPSGRYLVTVGDYDLRKRESTEQRFTIRPRNIKIHPRYKGNVAVYDIAIIKLPRPIKLNRRCAKAIRLRRNYNPRGQRCTVSGWGRTSTNSQGSQVLRSVRLETHNGEKCVSAFNIPRPSYLQPRPKTKVCAGVRRGGRDFCRGDSGGPLVCRDRSTNTFVQVGIVSYFFGQCGRARFPGIYTSTSAYYSWIKRNM